MENTLYLHFSNEKWVSDHEFSVFLFEFVSRDDTKNIMRAEFTCKIHILCRILDCNSRSDDVFGVPLAENTRAPSFFIFAHSFPFSTTRVLSG